MFKGKVEAGTASGDVSKGLIRAAAVLNIGVRTPLCGLRGFSSSKNQCQSFQIREGSGPGSLEILIFHVLIPKFDEKNTYVAECRCENLDLLRFESTGQL